MKMEKELHWIIFELTSSIVSSPEEFKVVETPRSTNSQQLQSLHHHSYQPTPTLNQLNIVILRQHPRVNHVFPYPQVHK